MKAYKLQYVDVDGFNLTEWFPSKVAANARRTVLARAARHEGVKLDFEILGVEVPKGKDEMLEFLNSLTAEPFSAALKGIVVEDDADDSDESVDHSGHIL